MSLLQNSNAISTEGGYNINNSLRFRSSATAFLSRTPSSAGNRQRWTVSFWIKLGNIVSNSTVSTIFCAGPAGTETELRYSQSTANTLSFSVNGTTNILGGNVLLRDPSAWYHMVISVDTTQATAANRFLWYINGVAQPFSSVTYPAQNTSMSWNNNTAHRICDRIGATQPTDCYLAEFYNIDGQQLTPTSFGETDTDTGVWKPKAYTGTYGTNGFYLKFDDASAATAAAIGKDSSGNGHNWTPNNISVTSGATYDAMTDSPTNTSTTVANYATLNPLTNLNGATLTDGNLTWSQPSTTTAFVSSTISLSQNYTYLEFTTTDADRFLIGVTTAATRTATTDLGASSNEYAFQTDGNKINGGTTTSYGSSVASGATGCIAFDNVNNKIYVGSISGTTITWFNSGDPVSGTNPMFTVTAGTYFLGIQRRTNTTTVYLNFGQRPFLATNIPTGFVRLNTFNLPDSTIVKGNSYMEATTYTGTGASLSVTNATGFRPDFVWVKGRSGATDNALYDAVRGTTNDLVSNSTAAATTQAQGLTAFNSNGFTVGTLAKMNTNAATYVAWQWQAGSSTVTNTSGTISAQVRANTTTGFSIVTYSGNGTAGATIGHGLGVAPRMIFVKTTNATDNWAVYHSSTGATNYLQLNNQNPSAASITLWNDTSPTSTVFSVGTNNDVNDSARTYVAYCWAEIAGFSAFGSYAGNGSTNGPFVYTGFRPKFILIKRTITTGSSWFIMDSTRNTFNVTNLGLSPDAASAEFTGTTTTIPFYDMYSNGFKVRGTSSGMNSSSDTYIYAAFAENPFKNSLAR